MTPQELIVYFIFLPPVIGYGTAVLILVFVVLPAILLWRAVRGFATKVCRCFGWPSPRWAVPHAEKSGFYPCEDA